MIYGIGTDIIEVARVAEKINRSDDFKTYVFTDQEIDYCESKTYKFECYAVRFAAKEAFLKALGTGWNNNAAFNEIEIIHTTNGKPEFNFKGKTHEYVMSLHFTKISLSLSHIKEMAVAMVVIES